MITENERLAMDFRDALLWKKFLPTLYWGSDRCSKCGRNVKSENEISFSITGQGHEEYYVFHTSCAQEALDNASDEEIKRNMKDKPVKIPF